MKSTLKSIPNELIGSRTFIVTGLEPEFEPPVTEATLTASLVPIRQDRSFSIC